MKEHEVGRLTASVVDLTRTLFSDAKSKMTPDRFPTYVDRAMIRLGLDPINSHKEVRTRALRVFQRHSVTARKKRRKTPLPKHSRPLRRFLFDPIVGNQHMLPLYY